MYAGHCWLVAWCFSKCNTKLFKNLCRQVSRFYLTSLLYSVLPIPVVFSEVNAIIWIKSVFSTSFGKRCNRYKCHIKCSQKFFGNKFSLCSLHEGFCVCGANGLSVCVFQWSRCQSCCTASWRTTPSWRACTPPGYSSSYSCTPAPTFFPSAGSSPCRTTSRLSGIRHWSFCQGSESANSFDNRIVDIVHIN